MSDDKDFDKKAKRMQDFVRFCFTSVQPAEPFTEEEVRQLGEEMIEKLVTGQ